MYQRTSFARSLAVNAADTNAHAFASFPCLYCVFQAHPANVGNVQIVGVKTDDTLDTAGVVLTPGDWSPMFPGPDLSRYGYKADSANDDVQVIFFV